ncbi:hypothetical protein KP79_PYT10643 [Mizuhopecten yessoensis]|uniref:Uncharacterized protein n=1 Tax=Mizuhopecten yessoensis TaxID=6573 RepID=A0A210QEQ8_MIZYE|nr:hypothetical protein KP79_PYT10643 [Mizuhopecten yessoensis]
MQQVAGFEIERDDIICAYHKLGLRQKEIVTLLQSHGFTLSERQLRRVLYRHNMFRRKNVTDIVAVATFLVQQLDYSGQLQGYRLMNLRCILSGLSVSRDKIIVLLQILDTEGVELRRRRRLVRRRYYAEGPIYIWHVDSYDKLKPYGIAVNGCVDGFLICSMASSELYFE